MASSFRCVLKDHNLREHRRPPSGKCQHQTHQKTLKHLPTSTNTDENSISSASRGNRRACNPANTNYEEEEEEEEMSRRHARVLDRWATQQAKGIISNLERRDPSPVASDTSSVSSLVQRWRGLEASCPNNNSMPMPVSASRPASVASSVFDPCDSDWESSDGALASECPPGGPSNNVADIIKKLPLPGPGTGTAESPALCCSPRIRGRHAVADLLSRLIRDRCYEIQDLANRHLVSMFPKRGRIQSLLKFKLLRGDLAPSHPLHHHEARNLESNKHVRQRVSSVNRLRRRFSPGAAQLHNSDDTTSGHSSNSAAEEASTSTRPHVAPVEATIDNHQEKVPVVHQMNKTVTLERNNHLEKDLDHVDTKTVSSSKPKEVEAQQTPLPTTQEMQAAGPDTRSACGDVRYVSPIKTNTSSCNIWEGDEEDMAEREEYGDDFCEPNLDWIQDISRPRSYWEGLRQAWYQDMLDNATNHDIRQLIERGNVSTVLASDFRDRMDQLMMSSAQLQMQPLESGEDEHHHQYVVDFLRSKMKSSSDNPEKDQQDCHPIEHHFVQESRQMEPVQNNTTGDANLDENEQIAEEDELKNLNVNQYQGGSYYCEQDQSLQLPWSSYREQDQSLQLPFDYDHDSQMGSSIKNSPTIEMELICDLRAHMEQVYREMSELRKSVNSCMEMQSTLHGSIGDEVSAAVRHLNSEKSEGKQTNRNLTNKGSCCVCNEKKVDSLLYRCGHMCACFKCAHELQWSSGKCPICWAQIDDVIRVYTDY